MLILEPPASGQNWTWLYGASGTSNSNSVTVDQYGHTFAAGGYDPNDVNFSLAFASPNYFPALPFNGEKYKAFLVRYATNTGAPQIASTIGVSNTSALGACSFTINESYATASRIVVNRNGDIFVMGVYKGCNITLYDAAGLGTITTNSTYYSSLNQKVFIARYDQGFNPVSCHIISSDESDVFPGDIANAETQNGGRLYAAVDLVNTAHVEAFGAASPPLAPFNNFGMTDPNDYDIYLAEFDVANDQLIGAESIGGDGNDFAGELSSGYLGYYPASPHLYLAGAFEGDIQFDEKVAGGTSTTTIFSNGDYDIFAIEIQGYNLSDQHWVTAGGPFRDEALALSDDGKYVGGYISEDATFNGFGGAFGPYTTSVWDTDYNNNGDMLEVAFFAIPDYTTNSWNWADDFPANRDSQVNSISSGFCGDFYMSIARGLHVSPAAVTDPNDGTLSLPYHYFWADHFWIPNSSGGGIHTCHSELLKWRDNGGAAPTLEWIHDFAPNNTVPQCGNGINIAARFITDLEISAMDLSDEDTDIIYTGRFGGTPSFANPWPNCNGAFLGTMFMEIPFSVTGSATTFTGSLGGLFNHGQSSMFIGGLDEHPRIVASSLEICLTDDPIIVDINFDPSVANGASYNIPDMNIVFSGPGITNSATGAFDPLIAGFGTHQITIDYDYFGCPYSNTLVATIEVIHEPFPIHPGSSGTGWAAGLAVESWSMNVSSKPYDIYFNAGRYNSAITFEKFDNTTITLTGNSGIPSGYVVAYGPCGALWATNFQAGTSSSGHTIETLVMDKVHSRLYVTGTVHDALDIINSNSLSAPSASVNGYTLNAANIEKGFVAKLNANTGQVLWIYYGSSVSTETNRLHGLDISGEYLFATGEYLGSFTATSSLFSLNSANTTDYDILVLGLDTFGNEIDGQSLGAQFDDHGDAISAYEADLKIHVMIIGDIQGGAGMNFLVPSFPTTYGNQQVPPAVNGTDVILAHWGFIPSSSAFFQEQWHLFDGDDDDHGLDVKIIAPEDWNSGMGFPNEVIFCGQFQNEIDYSSSSTQIFENAGGGATDDDGFVGTTDINLGTMGWFQREGSNFNNESFNALAYKEGNLYGVGKFRGTANSSMLGATPPLSTAGFARYGLFTVQFWPDGTLIDKSRANPGGSGVNQHTDVCVVDTSLITTGSSPIVFPQALDFHSFNSSGAFSSLSGNREVFIARFDAIDNAFFKGGSEVIKDADVFSEIVLYPNPNDGNFTVELSEPFTGALEIRNVIGQIVHADQIDGEMWNSTEPLVPGMYILQLISTNSQFSTKFIVQ